MSEKKMTLEERFSNIEQIINQMEDGTVSLDKSFALYKQGLSEIKAANEMLDSVEKEMLILNENGKPEEF